MGYIDELKKLTIEPVKKSLGLDDPIKTGRKKTTLDYFVDDYGKRIKNLQSAVFPKLPSYKFKYGGKEIELPQNVDPFGAVGEIGALTKVGSRVLNKAIQKGVSGPVLNQLSKLGRTAIFDPVSEMAREGVKRSVALLKSSGLLEDSIVKIRKAGNGTIKIMKSELETMKKMGDLKPTLGERYFQNPIRVFEELGEGAKELFYRPIKVAENLAIRAKNFYNTEFNQIIKGLDKNSSNNIMKYAVSQEVGGEKILGSQKITPLKPNETKVYEYIRTRYDSLLDELNEARAIIGKDPINKVKNYFTHIRDLNVLEQMGFSPITDDIESLLANKIHRNATAFQFAKKRIGSLTNIETDAFNVFRKYQEKALDHINLSPAITKVRELSRTIIPDATNELGKFKLQDVAPNAFKYISEWTDFVAGQKVQNNIPKVLENVLQTLNKNIAFATLSFNIRSAIIQPSAIINSVTELGAKNVGVGIKELLKGGSKFALEHSNVLKGRQFDTAIQDIANGVFGKTGRLKSKIAEWGIKPLQVLDSLTAQSTWLAAYNRAVTQLGKVGRAAYNYADDIVVKTQASAARSDVAKIQRSTLGRMATQFQTFVINDFNRIMRDVLGIGNEAMKKPEVIKKAITYLAGVSLWNYLSEDVLGIPSPFPRPIKALKEQGIMEAGKELSSQIPVIGGALRYGTGALGAAVDLTQQIFQKVNGKYTPASWWELAGKVFGIPGTVQLKKIIKGIEGNQNGYTVTTNANKRIKIEFDDPIDRIRALLLGPYETKEASQTRIAPAKPKLRLTKPD